MPTTAARLFGAAAGPLALSISLLTVSAQALRAAAADPVQSLRYEWVFTC